MSLKIPIPRIASKATCIKTMSDYIYFHLYSKLNLNKNTLVTCKLEHDNVIILYGSFIRFISNVFYVCIYDVTICISKLGCMILTIVLDPDN